MAQVKAVLPHIFMQQHRNQDSVVISTNESGITITMTGHAFYTVIKGDVEDGQFVLTENYQEPA